MLSYNLLLHANLLSIFKKYMKICIHLRLLKMLKEYQQCLQLYEGEEHRNKGNKKIITSQYVLV